MRFFILIFLLAACAAKPQQQTLVLDYSEFGPQIIASEVIGMEWWQWEDHGTSRPSSYPIKVVVYRNIPLETIKRQYPVNQHHKKDFRYIEYSTAIAYLDEKIEEDVIEEVTSTLTKTRSKLIVALGLPE